MVAYRKKGIRKKKIQQKPVPHSLVTTNGILFSLYLHSYWDISIHCTLL